MCFWNYLVQEHQPEEHGDGNVLNIFIRQSREVIPTPRYVTLIQNLFKFVFAMSSETLAFNLKKPSYYCTGRALGF